jgi:hypothetical protein
VIPRDYITEWRTHAPWVQDFIVATTSSEFVGNCGSGGKVSSIPT